jgi:predicted amidohydrolase YtcJ
MRSRVAVWFLVWCVWLSINTPAWGEAAADTVYRNGVVYTADAKDSMADTIAVRDGRIVYVGSNAGVKIFVGSQTKVVDLKGNFVMPGLVDGHMHPLEAGLKGLKCDLNYESLTVQQMQQKLQACLDREAGKEPDGWFVAVNWFQESMRPAGVKASRTVLDALKTKRPILVSSSFGHTSLVNSRALALAGITAKTPDPLGGKIWHDAGGQPTGLLEDAAQSLVGKLLPKSDAAEDIKAAKLALDEMRRQGVTSFLDAAAPEESVVAFTAVGREEELTARAHFAPVIEPPEGADPDKAVRRVAAIAKKYDQGDLKTAPGITVRNTKLFLDGVIAAPALTGNVLQPYKVNAGTAETPRWVEGTSRGPDVYFPPQTLAAILIRLGRAGIDPHMHADGDGAVRAALDAVAEMRKALPKSDIRPATAHDEIVDPTDFGRFHDLGVLPVLSFQWEKPAGDTMGLTNYFGPERMKILEPAGLLAAAGARIAFGSDWPVDKLDEWFALKVAVTRTNAPDAAPEYQGRLGDDPGLSRTGALRAATIDAAYELHEENVTGSLEVGKFADLIVLDRNPLKIPAEEIANVNVLETVVGGKVVYRSDASSAKQSN